MHIELKVKSIVTLLYTVYCIYPNCRTFRMYRSRKLDMGKCFVLIYTLLLFILSTLRCSVVLLDSKTSAIQFILHFTCATDTFNIPDSQYSLLLSFQNLP